MACIFAMIVCIMSAAQPVSEEMARRTAENFFQERAVGDRSKGFVAKKVTLVTSESVVPIPYIYNDGFGNFVMISKTDTVFPIVGYGEAHVGDSLPDNALGIIQMLYGKKRIALPVADVRPVKPLLKSVRSQYAPFNSRCPYYVDDKGKVSDERCIVGCVATALEQILSYHRHPSVLLDTLKGWSTAHYQVDTILPGTKLDFAHILNRYNEGQYSTDEVRAVSDLSYYCGIAAHMNWGLSSSGANTWQLDEPLKRAFGYSYVRHLYVTDYTPQRWRELLCQELEAGRPVYYAGYTTKIEGHAFVVDGIDENGFFHVNWGYGGLYDGYFDLEILNPFTHNVSLSDAGRWMGFCCNQEALLLNPDSVPWTGGDTISTTENFKIDSIRFGRQPDCNGYIRADVYVRNTLPYEATANVAEILTFEPGDTAAFQNGDYVGFIGGNIEAGSTACFTSYCDFTQSGRRVLAISDDDETFLYVDTLDIGPRTSAAVKVISVDTLISEHEATFYIRLMNTSNTSWTGNQLTYSIFQGDYSTQALNYRQWSVTNIPPGGEQTDTITFSRLKPGEYYTFVVRNPWLPVESVSFYTHGPLGIMGLKSHNRPNGAGYDLHGRHVAVPRSKQISLIRRGTQYNKVYVP